MTSGRWQDWCAFRVAIAEKVRCRSTTHRHLPKETGIETAPDTQKLQKMT